MAENLEAASGFDRKRKLNDVDTSAISNKKRRRRERSKGIQSSSSNGPAPLQDTRSPKNTPNEDPKEGQVAQHDSTADSLRRRRKQSHKSQSSAGDEEKRSVVNGERLENSGSLATTVDPDTSRSTQNFTMTKRERRALKKLQAKAPPEKDLITHIPDKVVSETADPSNTLSEPSDPILKQPKWVLSSLKAGKILAHDPVFVSDSNGRAFVVTSNSRQLQLWSLEHSVLVHAISPPANRHVAAFAPRASESDTIYVGLDDSTSFDWKWTINEIGKMQRFGGGWHKHRTTHACVPCKTESGELIFRLDQKGNQHIVSLPAADLFQTRRRLRELQVFEKGLFVLATGPDVIVLGQQKVLKSDDANHSYDWVEVPIQGKRSSTCAHARLITSIGKKGHHTHRLMLAIGTEEGQIHVHDDITVLLQKEALPPARIMHWHRTAVSSLKFSPDGNYIISGGRETVLVLWQLQTGKQQFLPHLTSEIERIVINDRGDRYALLMGDNSVIVFSTAELKAVATFGGLQMPVPASTSVTGKTSQELWMPEHVAAVLHPKRTNELLLTVPSSQPKVVLDIATRTFLQTFDLYADRHLTRQAVTRNNVTDFNIGPDQTPIVPPDASLLAISPDGEWLATVDEWTPAPRDVSFLAGGEEDTWGAMEARREVFLKIWRWVGEQQGGAWLLDFRVEAPHRPAGNNRSGSGRVLGLVANAARPGFATVGEDGSVKLWAPKMKRTRSGNKSTEWRCTRTVELETPHLDNVARVDSPTTGTDVSETGPDEACITWSQDGSMLAVALMYEDCAAVQVIQFINALTGNTVSRQGIVGDQSLKTFSILDRYLIVVTQRDVRLWDLVSDKQSKTWEFPVGAHNPKLTVDHEGLTFAIAVSATSNVKPAVYIFDLASKDLVSTTEFATSIASVLSVPGGKRRYVLLFDDATIRSLEQQIGTSGNFSLSRLPSEENGLEIAPAVSAEPAEWQIGGDDESSITNEAPGLGETTLAKGTDDVNVNHERPVVRPEQLASVFEGPKTMRDLFTAVVSLFTTKA